MLLRLCSYSPEERLPNGAQAEPVSWDAPQRRAVPTAVHTRDARARPDLLSQPLHALQLHDRSLHHSVEWAGMRSAAAAVMAHTAAPDVWASSSMCAAPGWLALVWEIQGIGAHPCGLRLRIIRPNEASAAALSWLLAWRLRCAAVVLGGGCPDTHHGTSAAAYLRPKLHRRHAWQHGGHVRCLQLHDFLKERTQGCPSADESLDNGLIESTQTLSAV